MSTELLFQSDISYPVAALEVRASTSRMIEKVLEREIPSVKSEFGSLRQARTQRHRASRCALGAQEQGTPARRPCRGVAITFEVVRIKLVVGTVGGLRIAAVTPTVS